MDLRRQALFALLYAILGTGVYISGRFEAKWFAALGLAAGLFVMTYTIPLEFLGLSPLVVLIGGLVAFIFANFPLAGVIKNRGVAATDCFHPENLFFQSEPSTTLSMHAPRPMLPMRR